MKPTADLPKSDLALKIVGGNSYGRYPKISDEQTFNWLVSDKWLVPFPGYKKVLQISQRDINGRALYSSSRGDLMIVVIDNTVYKVAGPRNNLVVQPLFDINSFFGEVFIDENLSSQIAICDQVDLWIYNFSTGIFSKAVLPTNPNTGQVIRPGYVTYHDGYFIVPDVTSGSWYLSAPSNGLDWFWGAGTVAVSAAIQTKPNNAVAVLRAPGRGNLIYVFGEFVTEMWNNVGAQLYPYQRNNSISIDYGCLSSSTIAAQDDKVVWLGVNEQSGPVLMVTSGSNIDKISTDGINFKLDQVKFPGESFAFFFRDSGHLIYQITFTNPADNFSLAYDFNSKLFCSPTDEDMNFHIAQRVAYYNDIYYFIGIKDGDLYEMDSNYTTYDYTLPSNLRVNPNKPNVKTIPRVRICPSIRYPDASKFSITSMATPIEQGVDTYYKASHQFYLTTEGGDVLTQEQPYGFVGKYLSNEWRIEDYRPRIDLSIAKDGAETFGSFVSQALNALGNRRNRVNWYQMGACNEFVPQFRVFSKARVVMSDGEIQVRHTVVEGKR